MKIAIIGAGNMGGAIAKSLVGNSQVERIVVSAPTDRHLAELRIFDQRIATTHSNAEAVGCADIVILAVKPFLLAKVIDECGALWQNCRAVVSVAAKVTVDDLHTMLSSVCAVDKSVIYRVIPNIAIEHNASVNVMCGGGDGAMSEVVSAIFGCSGKVYWVEENIMDSMTILTSCGMAFALRYLRAVVMGAVELGIEPDMAQEAFVDTLRGVIAMVENGDRHIEGMIDCVTTPGGITVRGLNAMETAGFSASVIAGMKASKGL